MIPSQTGIKTNEGISEGNLQGYPLGGTHPRHCEIGEDPTIQKLHNVEWGSENIIFFVQTVGLWDWDFSSLECRERSIFPLDLMDRPGEELSRRFLSQDIRYSTGVRNFIGWIGLSHLKLSRNGNQLPCTVEMRLG